MVDILLATHNSEKFLAEQLDSLIGQTYRDIHIIVSDDGSKDTTKEILQRYAVQHGNISILENLSPLGGAKENFFNLIRHSKSEYAMFADHDDVWYLNKVQDTLELMQVTEQKYGSSTPILVHTDLEIVDEHLNSVAPSMMRMQNLSRSFAEVNKFLVQNHVTGCTAMVNRALMQKVNYTSMEPIVMHDWWMALIASAFGKIAFLDKPTIKYRQHAANEIGAVDVHSTGYIKRSLSNIEFLRKKIFDTYRQSCEFYETYKGEFSPTNEEIIRVYAEFIRINKFRRWGRMVKYGLFKNGFIRIIGQFILG